MDMVLVFILGACIGSFLNVLADRLPKGESVLVGRSHCDYCKKTLRWFELVPLLSFIIQGGRCRRCHKLLSFQYPLVELITGLGFVFLYPRLDLWILFACLLVLFVSDVKYQLLPDSMIVIGTVTAAAMLLLSPGLGPQYLLPYIYSAVGGFGFLYILWAATHGRGMGFGDVKFAILMGLFLGYPNIVVAFYIAFLTGALVGVILILRGAAGWKSKIAFGPFLIVGTVMAYLWGPQIVAWWHTFI